MLEQKDSKDCQDRNHKEWDKMCKYQCLYTK